MKTLFAVLLLSAAAWCQSTVTVTGTVIDPNGNPYANGNISAQTVANTGQSTQTFTPVTLSSLGIFSETLPANTTYLFTACAMPLNIGPLANPTPTQVCFISGPIAIGSVQIDISAQLATSAKIIGPPLSSGSVTAPNGMTVAQLQEATTASTLGDSPVQDTGQGSICVGPPCTGILNAQISFPEGGTQMVGAAGGCGLLGSTGAFGVADHLYAVCGSNTPVDLFAASGAPPTFQTNGTNNSTQNLFNLQSASALNGITLTVTNSSGGNVKLGYSGSLTVSGGGTGATTFTAHSPLVGEAAAAIAAPGAGTSGQCFLSNGASADPTFQACPSGGVTGSVAQVVGIPTTINVGAGLPDITFDTTNNNQLDHSNGTVNFGVLGGDIGNFFLQNPSTGINGTITTLTGCTFTVTGSTTQTIKEASCSAPFTGFFGQWVYLSGTSINAGNYGPWLITKVFTTTSTNDTVQVWSPSHALVTNTITAGTAYVQNISLENEMDGGLGTWTNADTGSLSAQSTHLALDVERANAQLIAGDTNKQMIYFNLNANGQGNGSGSYHMLQMQSSWTGGANDTFSSLYDFYYSNPNSGTLGHQLAFVFRPRITPAGGATISTSSGFWSDPTFGQVAPTNGTNTGGGTITSFDMYHLDPWVLTDPGAGNTITMGTITGMNMGTWSSSTAVADFNFATANVAGIRIADFATNSQAANTQYGMVIGGNPGSCTSPASGAMCITAASGANPGWLILGPHAKIQAAGNNDQTSTAESYISTPGTGADTNLNSAAETLVDASHIWNLPNATTTTIGNVIGHEAFLSYAGTGAGVITAGIYAAFSGGLKTAKNGVYTTVADYNCENITQTAGSTSTNGFDCLYNGNSGLTIFTAGNIGVGSGKNVPGAAIDVNGTVNASNFTLAAGNLHTVGYAFGDAAVGNALTTSEVGYVTMPFACTIKGYHIMADSGTVTLKTARVNGGTALPTLGSNSISTSGVSLSSGTKVDSTTTSDFTSTALAANDTLGFFITTISGPKQVTFQIDCQ